MSPAAPGANDQRGLCAPAQGRGEGAGGGHGHGQAAGDGRGNGDGDSNGNGNGDCSASASGNGNGNGNGSGSGSCSGDCSASAASAAPPTSAAPPLLEARGLVLRLGERQVLRAVSASLSPGWTAVVGPNGAGKSSLLRTLAGLLVPQQGQVRLDGQPLTTLAPAQRALRIAWLAQQSEVSGELTVRETVALGRIAHLGLLGTPGAADNAAVNAAMALTECSAWSGRRLQALSGGERQRVLLARALATEAPVLLLDEPTTHLDAPHQVALARLFRRLARSHTVVTVLHDLAIALQADSLLVLHNGQVMAQGPAREPAVQRVVEGVFGGAIRIDAAPAGPPSIHLVLGAD